MPTQTLQSTCFVQDSVRGDKFSAKVTIRKRLPIRQTLQRDGKVELADIFIEPVSDNTGNHNHFVVTSLNGEGLYIIRDAQGNEQHRREATVWELGNLFGLLVTRAMQVFPRKS